MPLEPYPRGAVWWARGRVEYNGAPITEYYRCSTGASEEPGARDWCRREEQRVIRIHLLGEDPEEKLITFADAVLQYDAKPKEAAYLVPITKKIGSMPIRDISPKLVRELGPDLYPDCSTDTWTRQVVSPVRAVINNINDSESGIAFRVRGYTPKEKVAQDIKRKSTGRKKYPPGSWEWLLKFGRPCSAENGSIGAAHVHHRSAHQPGNRDASPHTHIDKAKGMVCIPGAKGHDDRWLKLPEKVMDELTALPLLYPRAMPANQRTCACSATRGGRSHQTMEQGLRSGRHRANIIPSGGRHGFGQEMNVRQRVDEKAAGAFGGWSDLNLMRNTYTHAEDTETKVNQALRRGLHEGRDQDRSQAQKGALTLYGFCTSEGRIDPIFAVKRREDLRNGSGSIHKFPIFQGHLWWARQGLNLRPHPCEGCALPLSYAPPIAREAAP
jgi:hypothetical protein